MYWFPSLWCYLLTSILHKAFIFISDFFRRNTNSRDNTKLTTVFDTSAIDIARTFKVQMAFVRFHKHKVIYDLNMGGDGAVSRAWNTGGLPANTTATTDVFDISWILDLWKEQKNHTKQLRVEFNITKSAQKKSKKLVLKSWHKLVKDGPWQQYGPVLLLAYFKDIPKLRMPLPSAFTNTHGFKPRSGSAAICKLYSFRATFAQLGLSDRFVKPTGPIDFFVCYGQCDASGSVDSRARYMTTHAWMLELARRVLSNPAVSKNNLQSSCVPTAYQGLKVLRKEANGNFVSQSIHDLTASACGCR